MKYQLTSSHGVIFVILPSQSPDERALIQFTGSSAGVQAVKKILSNVYGLGGHQIGNITAPADLAVAMRSPKMAEFEPQLIEGGEILEGYQFRLPDDVMS